MENNTYHITWFESPDEYHSKGENFPAMNARVAIAMYEEKYPNTLFLSCVSIEVMDVKNRQAKSNMG